jgi:hypothetical protein
VGLVGARGVAPAWPTFDSGLDSCSRTSPGRGSRGRSMSGRRRDGAAAPHAPPAGGPAGLHPSRLRRGRGLRARHQRDDGPAASVRSVSADRLSERGTGGVLARDHGRHTGVDIEAVRGSPLVAAPLVAAQSLSAQGPGRAPERGREPAASADPRRALAPLSADDPTCSVCGVVAGSCAAVSRGLGIRRGSLLHSRGQASSSRAIRVEPGGP